MRPPASTVRAKIGYPSTDDATTAIVFGDRPDTNVARLKCDPVSISYLKGTEVDFGDTATAAGTHPTQPPILRTPTRPVIEPVWCEKAAEARSVLVESPK